MSPGNSPTVEQTLKQPHLSPEEQGWLNDLFDGQGENLNPESMTSEALQQVYEQNPMEYEDVQEVQENTFQHHQQSNDQCSSQATPSTMKHGSRNLASIPEPVKQKSRHVPFYWDPVKLKLVQRDQMGLTGSQANPTASQVVQQSLNQLVGGVSGQQGSRSLPYQDPSLADGIEEVPEVRRTPSGVLPKSSMLSVVVPLRQESTGHHHRPNRFQDSSSAMDYQTEPGATLKPRTQHLGWENYKSRHPLLSTLLEGPRRNPMEYENLPLVSQGAGTQGSSNHLSQQVFQGGRVLQQKFLHQGYQNPNIHSFQQPQMRFHKVSEFKSRPSGVESRQKPFHDLSLPYKVPQHQGHPSGSHQKPFQGRHQPLDSRSEYDFQVVREVPGTRGSQSHLSGELQKTFPRYQQGRASSNIGQLSSTPSGFPRQPPMKSDFCEVVGDVGGTSSASQSYSNFRPLHQRGTFEYRFRNDNKLVKAPGCAKGVDWRRNMAPKVQISRLQEPKLFKVKTIPRPDARRQRKVATRVENPAQQHSAPTQWDLLSMADAPITEADHAALLAEFFIPNPPPAPVKKSRAKKATIQKKKPTRREPITDADEAALLAALAQPAVTVEKKVVQTDRLGLALFGIGTEADITEEEEDRSGMIEMAAGYWPRK